MNVELFLIERELGVVDQCPEKNKAENVRTMFGIIAGRYDLANHFLSLGLDIYWRKAAIRFIESGETKTIVDMCCGSGDFAFGFARYGAGVERIVGCDFSEEMIELAKSKEAKLSARGKLGAAKFKWQVADCGATGLDGDCFDLAACAFGLRNMTDLEGGLSEMYRVTKPGGEICVLEFSLPKMFLVRWVYLIYLRWFVPLLGGLLTGQFKAYGYLAKTIRWWDGEVDLPEKLTEAGFAQVRIRLLTFGTVTVYSALKPG